MDRKSAKILIVDDEEGVRESLKLVLTQDYELILTEDGHQALEILKNAKDIGLAFLDIKMPKMSGIELLGKIKEQYPKMPVIMVTGYMSVEMAAEATAAGASGYIIKPFKGEEILGRVKELLNN